MAIARRLGIYLAVDQLCRDYAVGAGMVPPALVLRMAQAHGLKARSAKLSWQQLLALKQALPVLLRLMDGSCLVLESAQRIGKTAVFAVRDPLSEDERPHPIDSLRLSQVWCGEVILFKRKQGVDDAERPFGLGWMISQVLRERRLFRDIGVAALVLSVLALAPPMLFMVILDRVLVHQRLSTLAVIAAGVGFVFVFDTVFGFLRRHLVAIATARIDARINTAIFDRLIGLPIDFFERVATGVIAYKLSEIRRVRLFLTGQLFGTVLDATTLLVLVPTMFLLNATLAALVLALVLLMCVIVTLYLGPIRRAYGRVIEAEHRKNALLIETLQGVRTVKALALEGRKRREWDGCVAEAVAASTALQHLANQPQTLLNPLEKLIYAGTLMAGAFLAVNEPGAIYAGTLVAFTMIANRATQPFVQIAGLLQQLQEVRGAISQVASIVNQPPERQRSTGARPPIAGAIAFSNVRFAYPGATTPALDGISFAIKAGTITGIMGRSGSGKTTVTRLLQGLHHRYEGLIKIDGIELREIDLSYLRENVGVVLQDSFLFHGTIRDNILAGRFDAGLEQVYEVARLSGAAEFIERLPQGYDTVIEEGSANLSGGQRQRLAIARTLLANPPVLIFDEATSALDPESEAIINAALRRIAHRRTVIIISHRLASLVDCDQILVVDGGRLSDHGRHEELLKRSALYRHQWCTQNHHLVAASSAEREAIGAAAFG